MASVTTKLFEDVNKDFLTCSICKDIFKHPKQLPCMHNFCQDCLQLLMKEETPCKINSGGARTFPIEGPKSPTGGPGERSEPLGCVLGGRQGQPLGIKGFIFQDKIGQASLTGGPAFPDWGPLAPLPLALPLKIKCPLCREQVKLEVDSVSELEDNIFLSNLCELFLTTHLNTTNVLCSFCSEVLDVGTASRCIECSDNLCEKCAKTHTLTRVTRNHQVILMSELETENLVKKVREGNVKTACQKHPSNHLEFFCQTCQVPVCFACTVVDHVRQNGHDLKHLHDGPTKETFKKQITNQVHQLEQMVPSFEEHIAMANDAEKCLVKSLEKTKKDIRATARSLIDEIEAHINELIEKVNKRAEAIQKVIENHREAAEIRVKSSTGINQFARNLCKHGLTAEIMSSSKDLLRRMDELQEDLSNIGTGELKFLEQKKFNLGKVVECKERNEYTLLEYYTKKEMAVGDSVKSGPNWPTGDPYDSIGSRYLNNTIQKIQREGQNKTVLTKFQHGSTIDCKMNRREYWLQPTKPSQSYLSRLEWYAEKVMKVGDIVHRGVHWPSGYDGYDSHGKKSGQITQIDRKPGNTTVSVNFGQQDIVQCPMYTGKFWLLPVEPIPWVEWAEI